VRFHSERPDVEITIKRQPDGAVVHTGTASGAASVPLAEGNYRVETRGPAKIPFGTELTVAAGQAYDVPVEYVRGVEALNVNRFTLDSSGWYTSKDDRLILLSRPTTGGSVVFSVKVDARRAYVNPFENGPRLSWVVGYLNEDNQTICEMDGTSFYVRQIIKGQEHTGKPIPHGIKVGGVSKMIVRVDLSRDVPYHQFKLVSGGKETDWKDLGQWPADLARTRLPAEGTFGLHPTKAGNLKIADFLFYPPQR
jgi:hypothetical protein